MDGQDPNKKKLPKRPKSRASSKSSVSSSDVLSAAKSSSGQESSSLVAPKNVNQAGSKKGTAPVGGIKSTSGSNLRANLKPTATSRTVKSSIKRAVSCSRKRLNPAKAKILPNQNLPIEASAMNINDQPTILANGGTVLDTQNMYDKKVVEEFKATNICSLAGTNNDPEQFLVPVPDRQSGSFLDRKVDARKLTVFIVNYMNQFYDLSKDEDPCSVQRREMDNLFWDTVVYLIPLLCNQLVELISKEPFIVQTKPDVVIFGDMHGNFNDLWHIYNSYIRHKDYANYRFVFLGDYVDRGPKSIEILCLLFSLKLTSPERFILVRGNHEVMKVNRKYGFEALCGHVFKDNFLKHRVAGPLAYKSFNRAFTYFPLGVVIGASDDRSVFCCHGGIPNQMLKPVAERATAWTIAELNALTATMKPAMLVPTKRAPPEHLALNEILWNDPIPKKVRKKTRFQRKPFYVNKKRGGHCSFFTEKGLQSFLEANHLSTVIRGHQFRHCKKDGYKFDFEQRLLTVFSSSNYCGTQYNATGCVLVTGADCQVEARTLRSAQDAQPYHDFNRFLTVVDPQTRAVTEIAF